MAEEVRLGPSSRGTRSEPPPSLNRAAPNSLPEGNDRAVGALDVLVARRQRRLRQPPGRHGNRRARSAVTP